MRKSFQMILALVLMMLGAVNVNAQERVAITADMFHSHTEDDFSADAADLGPLETAAYIIGEASSCPIGDTSCNAWADLGDYSKLYVKMEGCDADGNTNGSNPRIFINRLEHEGQFNADKAQAKCLVIPNAGTWAEDFYTKEGDDEYVIDLIKIKKEFGFVHLHSVKGSAWNTQAIVYSIEAEKAKPSQQVGWVNLINNSSMEGDDVSSFFTKLSQGDPMPSVISDGVGVDGSRGIVVEATAKAANAWDNQFWFRFNEDVAAGTKYRVSFDYRADADAKASTQAHAEPSDYIWHQMLGDVNFTSEWQTFSAEGTVSAEQAEGKNDDGTPKYFRSVAFNLNEFADANNYYFDNVKFEVFKLGTVVEYSNIIIKVDFGFDTNVAQMVEALGGAKRVFFTDKGCAKVKVNGEEAEIYSVEGLADGRFYIFLTEAPSDDDVVEVAFTNTIGLTYTSGVNAGSAVGDFTMTATYNYDVENEEGAYPYDVVIPTVISTDPEDGSFNLPTSTVFTITFDKEVDCSVLEATANGNAMTVSPSSGYAKEVTLSGSLSNGVCTIKIDKIAPELNMLENFGSYEFTVSIGKVEIDPNDTEEVLLTNDSFAACAEGGIPEGFEVMQGEELRTAGNSYSSGSRMFNFGEGGDFTKGLYFREGYCQTNPPLTMKAGKPYTIAFNSCMWKDNGATLDLKVLDAFDQEVFKQTVNNTPNVNGSKNAVSGSTRTEAVFTPESDGDYTIRWDRPGFNEVIIANVTVKYEPNVPGLKEMRALEAAIASAKATLAANENPRYQDAEYSNLQSVISYYEGWESTSPSAYAEAIAALSEAAKAQNDHHANCDEYETQVKKAIDVVRQNEMPDGDPEKATKFVTTALFGQLKDVVAKYHGSSEWRNMNEDPEGEAQWQLFYEFDVLMSEAELVPAIAELKDIANVTSLLFTQGPSEPENANGGKGTGVAVLVDRLRLGDAALAALGVPETDTAREAFKKALTDDDALAEKMKRHIKRALYGALKDPANTLFEAQVNGETLEEITPTYDMTVFVKNPNIYKQLPNTDFTEENVPGWTTPEGYNRPGLTVGWGAAKNIEGVAEDCMFQTWGGSYRVEQTIEDLPAGVYSIRFAFGERMSDDENNFAGSFAFATTSSYDYLSSDDGNIPGIGQAFPFASNDSHVCVLEEVDVTDGNLTIGVEGGSSSHTFFNEVRILLTAPLAKFDYAKAFDEVSAVETERMTPAKVRSLELFDLNGRRMMTAQKGVQIMKKHMSDGSIRVEKVVKK